MINKCKICGKEFEAKQRNHNICSAECREINQRDSKKTFRENNPDKVKQYIKKCNERVLSYLLFPMGWLLSIRRKSQIKKYCQ